MNHLAQIARTGLVTTVIGAMTIATMIAPADATTKTSTEQFARHICQSVIRVRPGVGEFDGCVSSLVDSVHSIGRDRAVARARKDCFTQGLKSDSTDLGLCLRRATDTKPGTDAVDLPDAATAMTGIAVDPQSSESYFAVSAGVKLRREQKACALLGSDPASGAFDSCVANLRGTLQAIDAPDV